MSIQKIGYFAGIRDFFYLARTKFLDGQVMFVLYKAQFQEKEVDKSNNLVYSLLIVLNKELFNFIENLGWLIYWEGAR